MKTAYDPDNVFNFEQSVPVSPAGPRSGDRSEASSDDARMLLDADERLR
nr:BBE domain-containing protein [Rhodococcus sp. ZPP]